MNDAPFRDFYRLVKMDPPTLGDFTSNAAHGRAAPTDPTLAAVWDGLSAQSTLPQARRKRRVSPVLGRYIATLRVPTDGSVRYERTLGGEGHHTIWRYPADLLARVVSIVPA